jgi:hypothetical protein
VSRLQFALLVAALAYTPEAFSQPPSSGCEYDACSLRLEGTKLVRGRDATVGNVGLLSSVSLAPLIPASADSAIAYARVFDRNYGRGAKAVAIGGILSGVAVGLVTMRQEDLTGVKVGIPLLGAAVLVDLWGAPKLKRAQVALSRAIWWNNRELSRSK